MTSLRLIETDGAPIAERTTPHLFETPPHSQRYRPSRWAYDISVVLHAMALVSAVIFARHLTPPPRPTPASPIQDVTSTFFLPKVAVDDSRHRRPSRTLRSKRVPAAIARDVAAPHVAALPAPAALEDSRVADTRSIADEKPSKSAFDPPIPAGEASLRGRRVEQSEAGLGSATVNVHGSPTAEIRPGGLGEGSVRDVGNGGATFSVRPGFDDASASGGGGAAPPRIQEPVPIPDY